MIGATSHERMASHKFLLGSGTPRIADAVKIGPP
jgi:hypothetical protein